MHGIVGRASITIIVFMQVTLHNKLKHLDTGMHVDVYCTHTNQAVSSVFLRQVNILYLRE